MPEQIVEEIIETGAYRILTSGQKPTAEEGIDNIRRMAKAAAGRIKIMCGSGVSEKNAGILKECGVDAEHATAKSFRTSCACNIMRETDTIMYSDKTKMSRNLRQLITKLERYINFLKDNEEFKTRFFEIGDGVAISRRRKKKDE